MKTKSKTRNAKTVKTSTKTKTAKTKSKTAKPHLAHVTEDKPLPAFSVPRKPAAPGNVIWHNPVTPASVDQPNAVNGFRVYVGPTESKKIPCLCGWAPWIGEHYRIKGGLEARTDMSAREMRSYLLRHAKRIQSAKHEYIPIGKLK